MTKIHKSDWCIINQKGKTAEIDIEGTIGGSWWDDEASNETKEKLKSELKAISELKVDKIIANIDSLGGLVNHAISMHDMLAQHSAEVETRIHGMTASSATVIAMAGDKITMSDNAMFLIHEASGGGYGNVADMESVANDLKKINGRIANIYVKRTENEMKDVADWMGTANGWGEWWDADEAKEKGFIDDTFEPFKAAANWTDKEYKQARVPAFGSAKPDQKEPTWVNKLLESITNLTKPKEVDTTKLDDKIKELEAKIIDMKPDKPEDNKDLDTVKAEMETLKADYAELARNGGKETETETVDDPPVDGKPKLSEGDKAFSEMATDLRSDPDFVAVGGRETPRHEQWEAEGKDSKETKKPEAALSR